jgi:hypothetical protein
MLDPRTLDELASFALPPRQPDSGDPFTNFAGGGYFYLDDRDRAVIPTTTRHLLVVAERADGAPGFVQAADYDLTAAVPQGDQVISALPDWSGRLWFATKRGVVGTVDPASGAVRAISLREPIGNSFAVDETGGVFIVSDAALYRLDAGAGGTPAVTWRETYANTGVVKPGQTEAGSGTTPTLMGRDLVAITDNADPMHVVVLKRAAKVAGRRLVCAEPVFDKGASDTDQSLIATDRAIVAENNYGYSSPLATENGRSTTGGLQRVDVDAGHTGCRTVWRSPEHAPSAVPKLSLAAGLVYTYTKEPRADGQDAWYLTAIDFHTGRTVFRRLGGGGLGFNNNYAPVTLGPDGTAYLGVLGGAVLWRDREPLPAPPAGRARPRLALRVTCAPGGARRLRLTGPDVPAVRSVAFTRDGRRFASDRRPPFAVTVRRARARRAGAHVLLRDGRRVRMARRMPACGRA